MLRPGLLHVTSKPRARLSLSHCHLGSFGQGPREAKCLPFHKERISKEKYTRAQVQREWFYPLQPLAALLCHLVSAGDLRYLRSTHSTLDGPEVLQEAGAFVNNSKRGVLLIFIHSINVSPASAVCHILCWTLRIQWGTERTWIRQCRVVLRGRER